MEKQFHNSALPRSARSAERGSEPGVHGRLAALLCRIHWLVACHSRWNGSAVRKSARSSRVERGRTHPAINQKSETLSNRDTGSKKGRTVTR